MGADYSFELIFDIVDWVPQFIGHNKNFLGSVCRLQHSHFAILFTILYFFFYRQSKVSYLQKVGISLHHRTIVRQSNWKKSDVLAWSIFILHFEGENSMEKIILESDVLIIAEFVSLKQNCRMIIQNLRSNSNNKFNASPGLRALGIY